MDDAHSLRGDALEDLGRFHEALAEQRAAYSLRRSEHAEVVAYGWADRDDEVYNGEWISWPDEMDIGDLSLMMGDAHAALLAFDKVRSD